MYVCFYCAQDEDCYLPLSTDLRDMKAIQTLLVRKRKWKAKAKPKVAFTDMRDASLTKEGECSVLQVGKEYILDSEILFARTNNPLYVVLEASYILVTPQRY